MKRTHLFFVIVLVAAIMSFNGCASFTKGFSEFMTGQPHANIVIDGYSQFGTYPFDPKDKGDYLYFDIAVPYFMPGVIPREVRWHWGNQGGSVNLSPKKKPMGQIEYRKGKIRATKDYYEDTLRVEVYYWQRVSKQDNRGRMHFTNKPIPEPLAKGQLNIVCWGKNW